MKKEKNEKVKTIILFLLMFFGINYGLYEYAIVPKLDQIEQLKVNYYESTQSQFAIVEKEDEKNKIENSLESLAGIQDNYDTFVLDQFDTVQMAYDVYAFSKERDFDAQIIRFNLSDIEDGRMEMVEAEEKQQQLMDEQTLLGPEVDPSMTVEPEILEVSLPEYRKAVVETEIIVRKEQLETLLKEIAHLASQRTIIKSMVISAEIQADETESTDVDSIDASSIDAGSTDTEVNTKTAIVGPEVLRVTIESISYIKSNGLLVGPSTEYSFKKNEQNQNSLEDLFSTQLSD